MADKPPIGNVLEFPLKPQTAKKIIVDLACNRPEAIIFTLHVQARMKERGVTTVQIFKLLQSRHSLFSEEPHQTPKGSWKFNLRGYAAGSVIEVTVDLCEVETLPTAYVVTVFLN